MQTRGRLARTSRPRGSPGSKPLPSPIPEINLASGRRYKTRRAIRRGDSHSPLFPSRKMSLYFIGEMRGEPRFWHLLRGVSFRRRLRTNSRGPVYVMQWFIANISWTQYRRCRERPGFPLYSTATLNVGFESGKRHRSRAQTHPALDGSILSPRGLRGSKTSVSGCYRACGGEEGEEVRLN